MLNVLALAALSLANVSPSPTFHDDYASAQKLVVSGKKPMAVFVGSGKDGWKKVVQDGAISPEVAKMLAEKFVCVYLDTDTQTGKALQGQFQLASRGLVISDSAGTSQVFSLSGSLTKAELSEKLVKYSDPKVDVTKTETVVRELPTGYLQPDCPTGR